MIMNYSVFTTDILKCMGIIQILSKLSSNSDTTAKYPYMCTPFHHYNRLVLLEHVSFAFYNIPIFINLTFSCNVPLPSFTLNINPAHLHINAWWPSTHALYSVWLW